MHTRVCGLTLVALVLIAQTPVLRAVGAAEAQVRPAQPCRVGATTAKTRTEGQKGYWSETTSTCRFDRATSKSTCTSQYVDSVGTKNTVVSVTTFASVADAIEEVKVIPPLRLSTQIDTKASGPVQASTTIVVNSYDGQRRLIKESVKASTAGSYVRPRVRRERKSDIHDVSDARRGAGIHEPVEDGDDRDGADLPIAALRYPPRDGRRTQSSA